MGLLSSHLHLLSICQQRILKVAIASRLFLFSLEYPAQTLLISSLLTRSCVKMAPRKPTATADRAKKKPANETNEVVKRPARGYYKYKNGFLNVTPNGGDLDL